MTTRRALVLTPDFPPAIGGIQKLVFRLVSSFREFDPVVVTPHQYGAGVFDDQQPYRILRSPSVPNHQLTVGLLNFVALTRAFRQRPEVVVSAHVVTGPAALVIGRRYGCPVLQFAHAQELGRRQALSRGVLMRSTTVIADSQYSRELVEALAGPRTAIQVIHPGVDCPTSYPDPLMKNASVVVVGRLSERYKGHDVLLQALALVRDIVPDVRLDVVGDGELRRELEKLAKTMGVSDITTFHGVVDDAARDDLLRTATVFAMPSRLEANGAGEGFGIVYIEAGAHGLPVVAGNVGGAVDAVRDNQTGLLVDPRDPGAVASAIITLLRDRKRARQLGAAGWAYARTLSWDRAARELESSMAELLVP